MSGRCCGSLSSILAIKSSSGSGTPWTKSRTRSAGSSLVDEANRVDADVIYWSTIHAPSGEQGIGPTATYLLTHRPCRVIIESESHAQRAALPA